MDILYEDNHLLVVNKPPGISTMGSVAGQPSVYHWAADYLKRKYNKPGNAYVGIVSRLDKDVSGVLVLARTSKAAARLSAQIRDRTVVKQYVAEVLGSLPAEHRTGWQTWSDWMRKNENLQRMEAVAPSHRGALRAELRIRHFALTRCGSVVEVQLITGRKHQIRVQLAARGLPIRGDCKYGPAGDRRRARQGIRLHCYRVTIQHPTLGKTMTFTAYPDQLWTDIPHSVWKDLERRAPPG